MRWVLYNTLQHTHSYHGVTDVRIAIQVYYGTAVRIAIAVSISDK